MKKTIILSLALLGSVFAQTPNNNEGTVYKYDTVADAQADIANIPAHGVVIVDGLGVVSDDGSGTLTPTTPSGVVDANGASAAGQVPVADGSGGVTWTTPVDDKGTDDQDASEVEFDDASVSSWSIGTTVQAALDTIKSNMIDWVSSTYEIQREDGTNNNVVMLKLFGGVEVPFTRNVARVIYDTTTLTLDPSKPNAGDNFVKLEDVQTYIDTLVLAKSSSSLSSTKIRVEIADGIYETSRFTFGHKEPVYYFAKNDPLVPTEAELTGVKVDDGNLLRDRFNVIFKRAAGNTSSFFDLSGGSFAYLRGVLFEGQGAATGMAMNYASTAILYNCAFFDWSNGLSATRNSLVQLSNCISIHNSNIGLIAQYGSSAFDVNGLYKYNNNDGCYFAIGATGNLVNTNMSENTNEGLVVNEGSTVRVADISAQGNGTSGVHALQASSVELSGTNTIDNPSPDIGLEGNELSIISF